MTSEKLEFSGEFITKTSSTVVLDSAGEKLHETVSHRISRAANGLVHGSINILRRF